MTNDPDRKRDEIANGDRDPPPGWPGRVGRPVEGAPRPRITLTIEGAAFAVEADRITVRERGQYVHNERLGAANVGGMEAGKTYEVDLRGVRLVRPPVPPSALAAPAEAAEEEAETLELALGDSTEPSAVWVKSVAGQVMELAREIALRRNVYRRRIADGRMTQADADTHMARIEAALANVKATIRSVSILKQLSDDFAALTGPAADAFEHNTGRRPFLSPVQLDARRADIADALAAHGWPST
jgi:hypothetical protein